MRPSFANELLGAAVHGHPDAVDLLISWGMQIKDIHEDSLETAIKPMLLGGNFGGVTNLISRGLELSRLGDGYLRATIRAGVEDAVEFLLYHGVDPNGKEKPRPLFVALETRHYCVARMLIAHGAKKFEELPRIFVDKKGKFHKPEKVNKAIGWNGSRGCNCTFHLGWWSTSPASTRT